MEGITGVSSTSEVAIDNIAFRNGSCERLGMYEYIYHCIFEISQQVTLQGGSYLFQTTFVTCFPLFQVTQSLYAFIKEDATDFKLDRIPFHSGWVYQFTVHALQTRNSSADVMYFVYPANTVHCAKSVTQELSLDDLSCFPRDFFFSPRTYQPHYKKLLLLNRGEKLPYGIALEEYHNCCGQTVTEYFFANVSLDRKWISELILSCLWLRHKTYLFPNIIRRLVFF